MKYEENFTLLRDLKAGDKYITKANTECIYLKNIGNDKHLVKDVGYNSTPIDGKECVVESGNFPVFKNIRLENESQPSLLADVSGWVVKEGDYAMVFDCDKWHVDKGDNSELWKKGKVLKVYWYDGKIDNSEWVVDVQFDDGTISNAHFLSGIKPCS